MARAQLELLANSLTISGDPPQQKVGSISLYIPRENGITGYLEFNPFVVYSNQKEGLVVASSNDDPISKSEPLPADIAPASSLIPSYPMVASDDFNPGIGMLEEVNHRIPSQKLASLSVPLLAGSQTVGVLLVSPAGMDGMEWTSVDRDQISRVAQSLSLALRIDYERWFLGEQNKAFRQGLSDSLHQVKNPMQALQAYGKILLRQIGHSERHHGDTRGLKQLAERLLKQSDKVVDMVGPLDSLVDNTEISSTPALPRNEQGRSPSSPTSTSKRKETSVSLNVNRPYKAAATMARNSFGPPYSRESKVFPPSHPSSTVSSSMDSNTDMQMVFLSEFLDPILAATQAIASENGVQFEVRHENPESEWPGVWADPKSLEVALSNLLDNAMKYVQLPKPTSESHVNHSPIVRVRIMANPTTLRPGMTIVVEDNGPGVQKCDHERIFQRGFRSASTTSAPGSGLGLDIAQGLVQRMGGTLEVGDHDEFRDALSGAIFKCTLFRNPQPSG
eukprot:Nitzschia sp. Nitz4//scaffold119_size111653//91804//93318//NITZ4_004208-RA/size111653-processed-gene-0.198-mRNA-1//-1//CDS//3329533890//765//frame0